MASLVCSEDYLVVTSGTRLKVIPFSDPSRQTIHDLKVDVPVTINVKKVKGDAKAVSAKDAAEGTKNPPADKPEVDPHIPTGRILTATFSKSGKLFAACTDQKELTLWTVQPIWNKVWTRSVVKRCMALTFDTSESALYVADKAGDVYQFSVEGDTKEGVLLLGHVSMLLDVAISPDNQFILTAERDEKIRVSHLPNAYNIHNFCLGHSEFVSRLVILPDTDHLISTAGDSSIRLWDYRIGKEVCKASYDWDGQTSGEKNKATATCISCCKRNNLVALTILQHSCVPVYHITKENGDWAFSEVARIDCKHPPWSLTFDPNGRLLILVPDEETPLCVITFEKKDKSFQVVEDEAGEGSTAMLVQKVCSDWDFLKCSVAVQSVFQGLHKVPFDNMPSYLERKQRRIETTKAKAKGGRRRKAQWRKGQKRSKADDEDGNCDDVAKRTMLDDDDDEEEEEGENGDEDDNVGNGDGPKVADVAEIS